jgi:phospholipid-binding lipoprotein MlaA
MVRSTHDKRLVVLLVAVLALALGGCGAFSEKLGTRLNTSLLERADGSSLAGPSTPSDATVRVSRSAAAGPAEVRSETRRVSASPSDDVATEGSKAAFIPVAFESIPPGSSSHLIAPADRAEGQRPVTVAQAAGAAETKPAEAKPDEAKPDESKSDLEEVEEYDPWESFNEKMFAFNYSFDKNILKPVAKGYNFLMPDMFQQMIGHGFDNIQVVPKLVNNILQWNWKGFAIELGRFLINSTFGIGGLFDIARQEFGLEKTKVDFGQTLGKWGSPPGPFLVLPFMPPMTVRDGIGNGVDGAMDPLGYVLPFFPDRLVMRIGNMVNERSLNLDLFQGFEATTVDLYSAVRNGYLQRRYNLIHNTP